MSENTPSETGSTDAPVEKRVRKPRVAKAAVETGDSAPAATPAQSALPLPATPVAPAAPREEAPVAATPNTDAGERSSAPAPAAAQGGQDGGEPRNDGNNHPRHGQQNPQGQGQGNRRDRFRNRRDRNRDRFRDDGLPGDSGNEAFVPRPHPSVPEGFPIYSLGDLKKMPAHKLLEIAEQLQITDGVARARKQDVIFALLKVLTRHGEGVAADGVLEILPDGFGFLRAAEASYLAGPDDTYISPSQTTSTFRRRRSAASTCAPATTSPAASASPRTANATSR
ncbi:Transcription termination factor Rho (fragment) [uncultured Stenotrophomonas sp.]|uniref:Transcription termination factor Rho n=1 Tax=uncultured Stenotrophomonas sp. TaxID=165438 RepID=A0A1Y5Q4D8_9GAMM